jgi:hypothetical protein
VQTQGRRAAADIRDEHRTALFSKSVKRAGCTPVRQATSDVAEAAGC